MREQFALKASSARYRVPPASPRAMSAMLMPAAQQVKTWQNPGACLRARANCERGGMRYTAIGSHTLSARKVSALSLGAMRFGTTTDEATSFAILDRYVEAGGNFIDTSNNYLFYVNRTQGGESEALLGRWRASRGIGDEIIIATKVGARPLASAADFDT